MMDQTAVLIPSYNEAGSIGGIVGELKTSGMNVYVVDDGSSDQTASIAQANGATVISNSVNRGKGASLKEGFSRILQDGFQYVLIMDGDGQHRPEDAVNFFDKLRESNADIVIGNRMSDSRCMPLIRVVVNQLMSFIISRLSGQEIPDSQCGFRLIKRDVLENLELNSSNYEMESELLIKAGEKGWKIASVPIKTVYAGQMSGIRPIKDTLRFFAMIFRILWKG